MPFIDRRQCLTLAKTMYTSCHAPLTTPFVIYHSCSILQISYHSLLFQMNVIEHVERLLPHAARNHSPHLHCRSMSFSHTYQTCRPTLNCLILPLSQYLEGFFIRLQQLFIVQAVLCMMHISGLYIHTLTSYTMLFCLILTNCVPKVEAAYQCSPSVLIPS